MLTTMAAMTTARKNHQYSALGARPLKSAYFSTIGRFAQSIGVMLLESITCSPPF
jgi:hypothetical protein